MKFDFALEPGKKRLNRGLVKNGKPMVSIITPYYNAGRYFEQTYNCVLNQTFPFFEWVIVNDGSTEKKDVELLERFAGSDRRIRVLHKENGGLSSARNHAIRNAETEILITLDPDDIIEPTYIEELYWALIYNPDAAWSYTNNVGFQNQEYIWNKHFDPKRLCTENFMVSSAAFRKSDLEEIGLYDEIARYFYEDWLLWLKLLSAGKKPVKVASYGFWYRRSDTGNLSIILRDPEKVKLSEHVIKEAAKAVDTTITAVEYPHEKPKGCYYIPKLSIWNKPFFDNRNNLHVLMLLPNANIEGAVEFNLDIVRGLTDSDEFDVGVITAIRPGNSQKQVLSECIADVFNLPDFLDMENWTEFISYYIKSRQVDILFLSDFDYGYCILPWIRKNFPNLAIVNYVHSITWFLQGNIYAEISKQMETIFDRILVCSHKIRCDMDDKLGYSPGNIEVLYTGIYDKLFDPEKTEQCIDSTISISVITEKLRCVFSELCVNNENRQNRVQASESLNKLAGLAETVAIMYRETEACVIVSDNQSAEPISSVVINTSSGEEQYLKSELLRIANSRIGKFLLKIIFKLKLNKLFK